MINSIQSNVSAIQMLNATNAFRAASVKPETITMADESTTQGIQVNDNAILKDIDTEDIKAFASKVGENNVSDDDIKYGLKFGRSVISDYII